jgi:hypothetical protein
MAREEDLITAADYIDENWHQLGEEIPSNVIECWLDEQDPHVCRTSAEWQDSIYSYD